MLNGAAERKNIRAASDREMKGLKTFRTESTGENITINRLEKNDRTKEWLSV